MQKTQTQGINKNQQVFLKDKDEKILVVKKNILFSYQVTEGLRPIDFDHYQKLIRRYKKFLWRSKVEQDITYKQIIPYLIFTHNNKFFIMRRKNNASEVRLQNKYSLGIGGHIKKEDLKRTNIIEWAEREFHEEVKYNGKCKIESIGILNDESNAVGQVHTGFVFLLHGKSPNIQIRNEHKEGMLVTLEECLALYNQMESWSQIVINYLKEVSKAR
jgi:predicted NUDIX family phosphoesterase